MNRYAAAATGALTGALTGVLAGVLAAALCHRRTVRWCLAR